MHARDFAATSHVKHIAHAQKLLGAHFTQNGSAVDL